MKYLFELSKEHKTIPKAEILSCLHAEDINYNVYETNEDIILIETNTKIDLIKILEKRLAFTYYIDEFLFSSKPTLKDIEQKSISNEFKEKGSIAIKYKNRSKNIKSRPIVKTLAKNYTKNRNVTLENPDNEIRGIITDSKLYVGIKKSEINRSQYEERKVQYRPFFSPISLHPKLARALINLSSIKKGQTLLDPFCGTGGIILEAGLIGAKLIGSDIEDKMIEGCKKTLDFFNLKNYKLFCSDIGDIQEKIKKVDAIVTDLPYGKSTTTKGEDMVKLYTRSFEAMSKLCKKCSRIVVGLPKKEFISLGQSYFSLIDQHDFKVHRSLNRHFIVYKN